MFDSCRICGLFVELWAEKNPSRRNGWKEAGSAKYTEGNGDVTKSVE